AEARGQLRPASRLEQSGGGMPAAERVHRQRDRSAGHRPLGHAVTHPASMTDLLDLPNRSDKPRQQGITHVLDRGLSVAEVDGLLEVAGEFVDIVKLGWGTALATGN